jgi:hypothetical protein
MHLKGVHILQRDEERDERGVGCCQLSRMTTAVVMLPASPSSPYHQHYQQHRQQHPAMQQAVIALA